MSGVAAKIQFDKIPTFDQLPVKPGAPPESAWGVFGDDDQAGCINFLTPEGVVEAARLVQSGKVFRLDAKIGFADPPVFGRAQYRHEIIKLAPYAHDDCLHNYNTQEGSQWDGLGHVGHERYQAFYNGVKVEEITGGPDSKLGIQHWADRFVGRGVLIDAWEYRKAQGRPIQPFEQDAITLDDLKGALAAQRTALKPGSILLLRTGWMEAYATLSPEQRRNMAPPDKLKSTGIEATREMVAWLWDNRVAAIGSDCPGVEVLPIDFTDDKAIHFRALPLLGLPLGEQFVLAPLAEDCARDGRYEFMVVSAPLNLEGGIASPPNAVAIK
jgi:kynurenine formamidase